MAHRNVHVFRRQTPIIYNQVNNYNIHHCHGGLMGGVFSGSVWSSPMVLMEMLYAGKNLFGGLFGGYGNDYASFNRYSNSWALTSQNQTSINNEKANRDSTIKNLETIYKDVNWIYQDGEFWGAKDGAIIAKGKNFDEVNAAMQKHLGNDKKEAPKDGTGTVTGPGTGEGDKDTYRIDKKTTNDTTYTVKNGNTWWGIVTANYDTSDLSGKEILELALRLAAANSGIEDETKAYAAARKGIYFKVGDEVKLPPNLKVNGHDIKRNDTITAAATQSYEFATGGTMMASIKATSQTSYALYVNGKLEGTYPSKEEAEKHVPEGATLEGATLEGAK